MPRTKQPGRDRDDKGRAKPLQGPTPETARKHAERAEVMHIPPHIEAGYAETTFGVLYARGMISVDQYEMCRELKSLHSILFGSGNARCSSVENAARGLPNERETKKMRERWAAYKHVMSGIVRGERDLFEHVVLRNAYREWMRFPNQNIASILRGDMAQACIDDPEIPTINTYRDGSGPVFVVPLVRELRIILRVIHTLYERLSREIKEMRTTNSTGYVAMSQSQKNALDGDSSLLDKLYANKGES